MKTIAISPKGKIVFALTLHRLLISSAGKFKG